MEITDFIGDLDVLGTETGVDIGLNDVEIGQRLENPVGSPPLEDLIDSRDRILLVVPDSTRNAGAGIIANLMVRRLIASGVEPYNIAAVFATGIHRPVTEEERTQILTPFLAQRLKSHNHVATDLMKKAGLDSTGFSLKGRTSNGIDVWLNRVLDEYERVVTIGSVGFHYFAGFSGGRKLICPGLASSETITSTHRLAFDFENKTRASGVAAGVLHGNPVHETFLECAAMAPPTFSLNTMVSEDCGITEVVCGHWRESHERMCEMYGERNTLEISEKRELVIVSCGGSPSDLNLIQAHKSLDAASKACNEGGTIVLLAECRDGLGREDFMKWFSFGSSEAIAEALCENYEVNGQTAWSLRTKTEMFDVRIVTSLDSESVGAMGMSAHRTLGEALSGLEGKRGYIIPTGHRTLVKIK
jgi:nickel-dependent lactate racemase